MVVVGFALVVVGFEPVLVEVFNVVDFLGGLPPGGPPPASLQLVEYVPSGAIAYIGAGLVSTMGLQPGRAFPGF